MLRNTLRTMAVPKMSQLRKGAGVKIVLKADQRTGKLTTGNILDILTRGDHPRGIKVRLTDGQIGRVQSLAPPHEVADKEGITGSGVDARPENSTVHRRDSRRSRGRRGVRGLGDLQEVHPLGRAPQESLSLFDYVRMPSSIAGASTPEAPDTGVTTQEQLESEFPKLDSALISAILVDYPEVAEAKRVLSTLFLMHCTTCVTGYTRAEALSNIALRPSSFQ
jgi:uncharacterized repeat protein (TIGR03833 family)